MSKSTTTLTSIVVTLSALVGMSTVTPAQAADCNKAVSFIERKACEKAGQGIDALRLFIDRTRMVYALYLPDYAHALPPEDLAKITSEIKVAQGEPR